MIGRLFIFTGPSAVGKDSLLDKIRENGLNFHFVVTTTSRPPRGRETEGHPYHFVSREQFQKLIEGDGLLEYAEVYGNYYGSAKKTVEAALENNRFVILRIDPQGAETVKRKMPEAKTIFILPPSLDALEERFRRRNEDSEKTIKKRLEAAKRELSHLERWDFTIVNEDNKLEKAAEKAMAFMEST